MKILLGNFFLESLKIFLDFLFFLELEKISEEKTQLIDVFEYKSPMGILGKLADKLFLKSYMKRFILERNQVIKTTAESDNYQRYFVYPESAFYR